MNLPTQLPETVTVNELLEHMALDKKIIDGKFRLVLLKAIGHAVITDQVLLEKITTGVYGDILNSPSAVSDYQLLEGYSHLERGGFFVWGRHAWQ